MQLLKHDFYGRILEHQKIKNHHYYRLVNKYTLKRYLMNVYIRTKAQTIKKLLFE